MKTWFLTPALTPSPGWCCPWKQHSRVDASTHGFVACNPDTWELRHWWLKKRWKKWWEINGSWHLSVRTISKKVRDYDPYCVSDADEEPENVGAGPSGPWFLLCFWDLKHKNSTIQMRWRTFSRRTFFQSLRDLFKPITSVSWIIIRVSTVPTSGEDPKCDSAVTSGRRLSASHPSRRHQQSLGLIKQDCVNTLSMKTNEEGGSGGGVEHA